jgi:hypothetical protein
MFKQIGKEVYCMLENVSTCDVVDIIAERQAKQLQALNLLQIPHNGGYFSIKLRMLRNINLASEAVFKNFHDLKDCLNENFVSLLEIPGIIRKVAWQPGFGNLLIQFVDQFGVPNAVRLFASGCFAKRAEEETYLDLFMTFVDTFGVPNAVRLFSSNCFTNRISGENYFCLFLNFVTCYGIKTAAHLFSAGCFANRISDDHFFDKFMSFMETYGVNKSVTLFRNDQFSRRIDYKDFLTNFFSFIEVCGDVSTVVTVYTTGRSGESFSISAEKPVFVQRMMDCIKFALDNNVTVTPSVKGNLSGVMISVAQHLVQIGDSGDYVAYNDAMKSATETIRWPEMSRFFSKCVRWQDLPLLQKAGFFEVYEKISDKRQISRDEIGKVVQYLRNNAGSSIEMAMQSVH